ncbi:hypothetical protein [Stenotrophomonas sp. GZD-301]|uniref:hypothetical protein n=1 Tax=Stenotrophomonas sp. GZD-301 TaxID=3404814 RepID=UPI003BB59A25
MGLVLCMTAALASASERNDLRPLPLDLETLQASWNAGYLQAMSEPELRAGTGSRTYRLLWLRTFHHPVAVRITASAGQYQLVATELDGAGGYAPGKVLRRKAHALTPEQFDRIEALIQDNGFWTLPQSDDQGGTDGSSWIIEAASDRHHLVSRWSPKSGPVRSIGEAMLALTGWRYGEIY